MPGSSPFCSSDPLPVSQGHRLHRCLPTSIWIHALLWLVLFQGQAISSRAEWARWYSIRPFQQGHWDTNNPTTPAWISPMFRTAAPFSEAVLSWKSTDPTHDTFGYQFELLTPSPVQSSFSLGTWMSHRGKWEGRSAPNKTNSWGTMETDLLKLHAPTDQIQVRVTLLQNIAAARSNLTELFLSTASKPSTENPLPPNSGARAEVWGKPPLDVPTLSQHAYQNGKSWCSPTCLTMLLRYWSPQLHITDSPPDVPEVASWVHDPTWGGTGNWSFNVAALNRYPQLRGLALRLNSLQDLEQCVAARVPVVISVSLNLMRGQPRTRIRDGHLVVVCGFDDKGDVWVNDPDATHPPVPSRPIRRKYRREDVLRGWEYSNKTAYLIWPSAQPPPIAPSSFLTSRP